jgi:hypothetical protein
MKNVQYVSVADPDPNPLFRGTDPDPVSAPDPALASESDPSIMKQKYSKEILDSNCLVTFYI